MVSELFIRLQARYGHKWTSSIDGIEEVAVQEWSESLAGLTGEQIKTGWAEWKESWPPAAPEFKAACIGKKLNDFGLDYVPECYRNRPERQRERLLSSDDRDARRKKLSARMGDLKSALQSSRVTEPKDLTNSSD